MAIKSKETRKTVLFLNSESSGRGSGGQGEARGGAAALVTRIPFKSVSFQMFVKHTTMLIVRARPRRKRRDFITHLTEMRTIKIYSDTVPDKLSKVYFPHQSFSPM